MPKKKGKKDGKSKKPKKNDKEKEEAENAAYDLLLSNFKKSSITITGNPPTPTILKAIQGPSTEKGAEDMPGWYDRKTRIQVIDVKMGPALCRSLCRSILGSGFPVDKLTRKPISYQLLQNIHLVGCAILDSGVTSLCEILTVGETIGVKPTVLELANCGITYRGIEHLGLALSGGGISGGGGNTCLQKLLLDGNKNIGNRGFQSLCIGLRGNSTLKTLTCKCCGLEGQAMGTAIALLLSSQTSGLEHLDVSENKLTPVGLSIVARALKKSIHLKTLGLAENNIDADYDVDNVSIQ